MATSAIEGTQLTGITANPLTSHFRLTRDPDGWVYEVGTVDWPEPSKSVTVWIPFRRWKREPGSEQVTRARAAAEKRFCARCRYCGELKMKGNVIERNVCHGCAQTHLHVCF